MRWLLTKQMVVLAAVAIIVALCTSSAQAQDANDPNNDSLFDPNRIFTFDITMDSGDWDAMVAECPDGQCPYPHQLWPATLECGDLGPMLVGIRRKNDIAEPSEADPQKVSIKMDINWYVPGQLFAGKKKLSLECGSMMSLVTEGLTWNLYKEVGIISSRAAWCKVYVNGSYKGVYANVEQVDKRFLAEHGLDGIDNDGFLWKEHELMGEMQRTRELETSPFAFNWYPFDHPDDPNNPEVPTPGDWLDQIQWRINIPDLLALAAVENFTANTDGAMQKMTNYWYYDWSTDPNDDPNFQQPRLYFPWDLDSTLRDGEIERGIIDQKDNGHIWEGLIEEVNESGIPFGYPTHQADYLDTYTNLLEGPLELSRLLAIVNNIESVVAAEMDLDPYSQLIADINADEEFQRIRDFLTDRNDYVTAQLDALAPLPGTVLLDDGFEGATWDANFNDVASTWTDETTKVRTGSHAAGADRGGGTGYFTSDALDASDANAIYLRFFFQQKMAATFTVEYYGSTGWSTPVDLTALGGDSEWLYYGDTITDANYFVADFAIRFNAGFSGGGTRSVEVDDVEINKKVPAVVLPIISGYILDPCAVAVSGVSVDANGLGGSDISDANGYYEVNVPSGWSGVVTPTKTGYSFAPTDRSYISVTADQNDQDYTATLLTYTISGTVTSGGPGLDGVTMNGLPGNPVTSGGGIYTATVPYDWGGTVTPAKTGYTFAPASRLYSNVTSDQLNEDYTATLLTYTISGTILDPGAAPVAGVSVDADSGGGSDVTDPNGEYGITVDYGWSGTVTPTETDYTFAPTERVYGSVTSNQSAQDYTGTHVCDLYPDGLFDLRDVDVICENWLTVGPDGDINDSGHVDLGDFALLADKF